MKPHPLRKTCATLLALLLILPFDMPAQSGARNPLTSRSRRVLEKENTELRTLVDSLLLQIRRYQEEIQMRDSIEKEMIGIYGENEGKSAAGLNPEDYSPELTDSLLSVWYLQRQVRESMEGENTRHGLAPAQFEGVRRRAEGAARKYELFHHAAVQRDRPELHDLVFGKDAREDEQHPGTLPVLYAGL